MLANPLRTFRCPNCNEMINDSMTTCRFCSTPVDSAVASMVADRQEKTNQACSDASYLKTAAFAMYAPLGLSLLLGFFYWGFVMVFFVVLFLLIRWQMRFGSLMTNDPDYQRAKSAKNTALILLIVAFPVGFILRPLFPLIIAILAGEA